MSHIWNSNNNLFSNYNWTDAESKNITTTGISVVDGVYQKENSVLVVQVIILILLIQYMYTNTLHLHIIQLFSLENWYITTTKYLALTLPMKWAIPLDLIMLLMGLVIAMHQRNVVLCVHFYFYGMISQFWYTFKHSFILTSWLMRMDSAYMVGEFSTLYYYLIY